MEYDIVLHVHFVTVCAIYTFTTAVGVDGSNVCFQHTASRSRRLLGFMFEWIPGAVE